MQAIGEAGLALAMIAAFLLGGVGLRVTLRGEPGTRQRGLLMIAAALVLIANVLIWTL
ncbi:MAG: hypothetical protein ABIQ98_07565 [Sphingomicrobium sp.]